MTGPLYEFLGYEGGSFAAVPTSTGFAADIPKRDAIVEAFKVRIRSLF